MLKLTGVDGERDGLLDQNGASRQILDIAGVVGPAVISRQIGEVQVAVLPHHNAIAQLDMSQPCKRRG